MGGWPYQWYYERRRIDRICGIIVVLFIISLIMAWTISGYKAIKEKQAKASQVIKGKIQFIEKISEGPIMRVVFEEREQIILAGDWAVLKKGDQVELLVRGFYSWESEPFLNNTMKVLKLKLVNRK